MYILYYDILIIQNWPRASRKQPILKLKIAKNGIITAIKY